MIEITDLCGRAGTFRLGPVSLLVPAGSHTVLTGPSGTGKTTLLETICGLRQPESGRVLIAGQDVTTRAPAERGIGFVPQDGALFPHLDVRGNIAFSLRIRRESPAQIGSRVDELAVQFGLSDLLARPVTALSGGEKQRVALARAVAFRPAVLLLDEPFSALDLQSREILRQYLRELRAADGTTLLHVSHDPADAHAPDCRVLHLDGIRRSEEP